MSNPKCIRVETPHLTDVERARLVRETNELEDRLREFGIINAPALTIEDSYWDITSRHTLSHIAWQRVQESPEFYEPINPPETKV